MEVCIAVGSVVEYSSVVVDSMAAVHNSAVEEVCIAAGSAVDNTVVVVEQSLVDQNTVGTAVVQLEVAHHLLRLPYSFQTE